MSLSTITGIKELGELLTEYTVPSFRLHGRTLKIYFDVAYDSMANRLSNELGDEDKSGYFIQLDVDPGLWFVEWGPMAYQLPRFKYTNSYRPLILYRQDVDAKSLPSFALPQGDILDFVDREMKKKYPNWSRERKTPQAMGGQFLKDFNEEARKYRPFNAVMENSNVLLCSDTAPLLNLRIDAADGSTVKISPFVLNNGKVVVLFFTRHNLSIEGDALDITWKQIIKDMEEEITNILKQLDLTATFNDKDSEYPSLDGITLGDIRKLFSPAEVKIITDRVAGQSHLSQIWRNVRLDFGGKRWFELLDIMDENRERPTNIMLGREYEKPLTRRLSELILSYGMRADPPPISPVTVEKYGKMYLEELRRIDGKNPHTF